MREGLADTSVFTAAISGRQLRAAALPDRVAISTITLGELRAGLLIPADLAVQDRRLAIYLAASRMDAIPIDAEIASAWARLRAELHRTRRTLRVNASWIAATAIAMGVPVICHGYAFDGVPGLGVISV
jgi:predicted nucleic acid-binding protein